MITVSVQPPSNFRSKWFFLFLAFVVAGDLAHLRAQDRMLKADLSEFVFTQAGELPIIISAPHGGTGEIPGVEKRKGEGLPTDGARFVTGRDTGTQELAYDVAAAIRARFGKSAYMVVSKAHRRFLDPNRSRDLAYEDPDAKPVYDHYHDSLADFCRQVTNRFQSGLLIDLHGQASKSGTVFRGTQNGSTVKHLRDTFGELSHTGDKSLFAWLQQRGWVVDPVPMTDKEQAGFTGGYIVQTYGSSKGSVVDAIQLEFGLEYRNENRRVETARVLANAVADYAEAYLKIQVPKEAATQTTAQTTAQKSAQKPTVRIAVFVDGGVGPTDKLMSALAMAPELKVTKISSAEIREGKLNEFDVLIHPGGSGSKQGLALGEEGRERVRDFVRNGKGLVGICAGAYLATCHYDWSLNLLDAKVIDREHWNRGSGNVDIALSSAGSQLLGVDATRANIHYFQGPLLGPAENDSVPDYESLATYIDEITKNGAPKGVMPGTTAIACGEFEKGRVICFSPHPEKTPGLEGMLLEAIDWVARKKN